MQPGISRSSGARFRANEPRRTRLAPQGEGAMDDDKDSDATDPKLISSYMR
jgi:hypothetical protein